MSNCLYAARGAPGDGGHSAEGSGSKRKSTIFSNGKAREIAATSNWKGYQFPGHREEKGGGGESSAQERLIGEEVPALEMAEKRRESLAGRESGPMGSKDLLQTAGCKKQDFTGQSQKREKKSNIFSKNTE